MRPHKYIHVALIGIHADEVSNRTCASARKLVVHSTTTSLKLILWIEEHTLNFKGSAARSFLENFIGRDADESYGGEASVYKAQLCAQLNDTQLC